MCIHMHVCINVYTLKSVYVRIHAYVHLYILSHIIPWSREFKGFDIFVVFGIFSSCFLLSNKRTNA